MVTGPELKEVEVALFVVPVTASNGWRLLRPEYSAHMKFSKVPPLFNAKVSVSDELAVEVAYQRTTWPSDLELALFSKDNLL